MDPTEEILQMMRDSRWIYDQALYHQRQKFFETFKEGKIKSSLDVTNFLDGLLQPLMQKLLDTELDNHLEEYSLFLEESKGDDIL